MSTISSFFLPRNNKRPRTEEEEENSKEENATAEHDVIVILDDDDDVDDVACYCSEDGTAAAAAAGEEGIQITTTDHDDLPPPKEVAAVAATTTTGSGVVSTMAPADNHDSAPSPSSWNKDQKQSARSSCDSAAATPVTFKTSAAGDDDTTKMNEETTVRSANPFAKFAATRSSTGSTSLAFTKKPLPGVAAAKPIIKNKKKQPGDNAKKQAKVNKKKCDWVPFQVLALSEQTQVIEKWHGLVDHRTTVQEARFQLLVAALLHARCQEPTVQQALDNLRRRNDHKEDEHCCFFTVNHMATLDAADLVQDIQHLQYYNAKANYITSCARIIQRDFHGYVPHDETTLLQLPGIGPVFANLLAHVNTVAIHQEERRKKRGQCEE